MLSVPVSCWLELSDPSPQKPFPTRSTLISKLIILAKLLPLFQHLLLAWLCDQYSFVQLNQWRKVVGNPLEGLWLLHCRSDSLVFWSFQFQKSLHLSVYQCSWCKDFPPNPVLKYYSHSDCASELLSPFPRSETSNTSARIVCLWRDMAILGTLTRSGPQSVNKLDEHVLQGIAQCEIWPWSCDLICPFL